MILVTGATGLIGSHLCYHLVVSGNTVRAIYRDKSRLQSVAHVFSYYTTDYEHLWSKIEWVQASLTDISCLTKAFDGIEMVYHLAGYVSFNPKHFYKLKKSNIEGTANVVNLCLAFHIKKLCHMSSIAVLSQEDGNLIDEENSWDTENNNNVYAITKYWAEMEVWRAIQEGLQAVIVNPGVVLGGGYWHKGTGVLFKKAHQQISRYPTGTMGFVDVVDVVKICMALMESTIFNERFIIVSENVTYKSLFETMAKAFHKLPPQRPLKNWMLQLAWQFENIKGIFPGLKPRLFKSMAKAMQSKKLYSNQKIKNRLGYSFIPIKKTVYTVAEQYLNDLKTRS